VAADVDQDMLEGTTLNPQQAIEYGLVHEVEERLFPRGAELVTIAGD
jgi:ATP-dependent protease ClpP protease subunit